MGKRTTSNLEKQAQLADYLDCNFYPQLSKQATELGVTIIRFHDSIELGGSTTKVNKLLTWIKEKSDTVLQERRL